MMKHKLLWLVLITFCLTASSCSSEQAAYAPIVTQPSEIPPESTQSTLLTTIPLETPMRQAITCADLDSAWAAGDWPNVLAVIEQLKTAQQSCGSDSLDAKLYAAHFNYAVALEAHHQQTQAIDQYRAALAINNRGREPIEALARLNALPTLPPPPCNPTELPAYTAAQGAFVTISDHEFKLNGQALRLQGVNYYPRHAPWEQFLTNSDLQEVASELDLIAAAGFNTVRIAVWYDPLFTCDPENAIPNAGGFAKLDAIMALARERDLHLIVTLNDLPDLYFRPLYTDYARYDAQTAFIVKRYKDEPAILAWDLRNEGDLDYGANNGPARFSSETVLNWLAHLSNVVRQNDNRHLITAGWWGDASVTNEWVDFLSFHHWTDAAAVADRIKTMREKSAKPIILEEVGYPAWDQVSEANQAQALRDVISKAEEIGVAGWLVWAAFDFIPPPGQASSQEYYFGLWRTDLTPKPALSIQPLRAQP